MITSRIQPRQPLRSKRIRAGLWVLLAVLAVWPAQARDIHFGDLVLTNPRVYCASDASDSTIGLLSIRSNNLAGDTLTRVSIEKSVGKTVEIQRIVFKDGTRKAFPIMGLDIDPGTTLELKLGQIQLAFMGRKKCLKPGSTIEAELTFRNAGAIVIEFEAETQQTFSRNAPHVDRR